MLAELVVRHRWPCALGWLLAAAWLLPRAWGLEDRLEVSARQLDSESAQVERLLARSFESPFAHGAVLDLAGVPRPDTAAGRSAVRRSARTG